jgi:hypothetical protein
MRDGNERSTGIASHISSLKGDVKSLTTKGIPLGLIDAMQMLVEAVLLIINLRE